MMRLIWLQERHKMNPKKCMTCFISLVQANATTSMEQNADNVVSEIGDTWKSALPYTNPITCYDIGMMNEHGSAMGSPITQGIFGFIFFVDPKHNGDTVYMKVQRII